MGYAGYMWECECGNTAYGEDAPEECPKCNQINSFVKLPEEIAKERHEDEMEDVLE